MNYNLTVFLLLLSFSSNSQYRIAGKIIDSISQTPLAGVSIFLSNTTNGTNSKEKGDFQIDHIKQGKYDLVVSSLNYESYIIPIQITQNIDSVVIKLKPTSNILKEVTVEPYDKNGWEKWGENFKTCFIGAKQLSTNCKLLNPEVVKFKYNEKSNKLRAFANEKLVFENKNLGYKITYLLSKFEIDFSNNTFSYIGYPLFEELKSAKTKEANKWIQIRNDTYKGSLRQFIRSLYFNRLNSDGFELREVRVVTNEEKSRIKELLKQIQDKANNSGGANFQIDKDSLDYYLKVNKLSDEENRVTLSKLIPRDSIVFVSNSSIDPAYKTVYFKGNVEVMYLNKKIPYEYAKFLPLNKSNENITTVISLRFNKSIVIYQNGNYFNGIDLLTEGYWAWSEKLSSMLPSDFIIK